MSKLQQYLTQVDMAQYPNLSTLREKLGPIIDVLYEVHDIIGTYFDKQYMMTNDKYHIPMYIQDSDQYHKLIKNFKKNLKQYIIDKDQELIKQSERFQQGVLSDPFLTEGKNIQFNLRSNIQPNYFITIKYSTDPIKTIKDICIPYYINGIPYTIDILYGNIVHQNLCTLITGPHNLNPYETKSLQYHLDNLPNKGRDDQNRFNGIHKNMLYKILLGLRSLHDRSIYHCNLHTSNVLFSTDYKSTPIITDFSNSIFMITNKYDVGNDISITKFNFNKSNPLTPPGYNIIDIRRKPYITKYDIWCYGILLLNFITCGEEERYISKNDEGQSTSLDEKNKYKRDNRHRLLNLYTDKYEQLIYFLKNERVKRDERRRYYDNMDNFYNTYKNDINEILSLCLNPANLIDTDVYTLINHSLFGELYTETRAPPDKITALFKLDKYYKSKPPCITYIDPLLTQLEHCIINRSLEFFFTFFSIFDMYHDKPTIYEFTKFINNNKLKHKDHDITLRNIIYFIKNILNYDIFFSTGYHYIQTLIDGYISGVNKILKAKRTQITEIVIYKGDNVERTQRALDINIIHIFYLIIHIKYKRPVEFYTFYKVTFLLSMIFLNDIPRILNKYTDNSYVKYIINVVRFNRPNIDKYLYTNNNKQKYLDFMSLVIQDIDKYEDPIYKM